MTKTNLFIFIIIIATATATVLALYIVNNRLGSSILKNMVSDTVITANIKSKIIAESDVEALSIHAETVNGQVTLKGNVPSDVVKTKVEGIAMNTEGVNAVQSCLEVDGII